MAIHRATTALLLIVSLFAAVATMHPNKTAALHHDTHGRVAGYVADVVAPTMLEPKPTCDTGEAPEPEPKPGPEPRPEPAPEPKPELTYNKVHGVRAGETCCSVGEDAGLTQDQFLGFNPNLCCKKLFVG